MTAPRRSAAVLHEDEDVLFVAKPARILSVPAPSGAADKGASLLERLRDEGRTVRPVHRLDYETSGVMVFAKTERAEARLLEAFRDRRVEKTYLALVQGHPNPPRGRIDLPIKDLGATAVISVAGAPALTHYEVLRRIGPCALVRCLIPTGRHNQIRIHMAHFGHPLVGERKFARGSEAIMKHKRSLLHAASLAFHPPLFGEPATVSAPLPPDFESALKIAEGLPPEAADAVRAAPAPRTGRAGKNRRASGTNRPRRRPPRR